MSNHLQFTRNGSRKYKSLLPVSNLWYVDEKLFLKFTYSFEQL